MMWELIGDLSGSPQPWLATRATHTADQLPQNAWGSDPGQDFLKLTMPPRCAATVYDPYIKVTDKVSLSGMTTGEQI